MFTWNEDLSKPRSTRKDTEKVSDKPHPPFLQKAEDTQITFNKSVEIL